VEDETRNAELNGNWNPLIEFALDQNLPTILIKIKQFFLFTLAGYPEEFSFFSLLRRQDEQLTSKEQSNLNTTEQKHETTTQNKGVFVFFPPDINWFDKFRTKRPQQNDDQLVEGTQWLLNKNRNPLPIKEETRRPTLLIHHTTEDNNPGYKSYTKEKNSTK